MFELSEPTALVEATMGRLQVLTVEQGGYVPAIEKAAGPLEKMDTEAMQRALYDLAGRAPAVLVALDKIGRFRPNTELSKWECDAELMVYCASNHRESLTDGRLDPADRSGTDASLDPGLRALYMDVFKLLAGWAPPGCNGALEPMAGNTVAVWQDATLWAWRFIVQVVVTSVPDDEPVITSAYARIEAQNQAGELALVVEEELP